MTCEAHKSHRPEPLTSEAHHVIPQAWQNYALGAEKLFDKRTVLLCPTGHRNVHTYIVMLMKEQPVTKRSKEANIARLALSRWLETGRTLEELRERKLYGQA